MSQTCVLIHVDVNERVTMKFRVNVSIWLAGISKRERRVHVKGAVNATGNGISAGHFKEESMEESVRW